MLPLPSQPGTPEPFAPSKQLLAYRNLKLQDPPRNVTLNSVGKLLLVVPLFMIWIFYLNLVAVLRHPWHTNEARLLLVFAIPVLLTIAAKFIVQALRHRKLLRTGSYSIGTVIAKQKPNLWSFGKSAIAFEFPVGGHKPMTGRGFDWTGKYSVNKPLLVFYAPSDISCYVALCSTPWRVPTHSGELSRP
jgi:hypothetical protein